MLTFGTAWVYEQKSTGHVVANCHKQPESVFTRRRLSVQEIVSDYTSLFSGLIARNPKLKVILTVSPIRHVRDGMHANQLSKATLLLAIDQLQTSFPGHVFYFRLMNSYSTSFVTIVFMPMIWCIHLPWRYAMYGRSSCRPVSLRTR